MRYWLIDDGSPDGTGAIVTDRSRREERIQLLQRTSKQGLGTAYVAGFQLGLQETFNFFIEMDADLSHDPADLPRLLAAAEDADLVIGSRYTVGGTVQGWSRARHLLSRCANLYARAMLGFPINDSTSGFRCYRREVLETLDLSHVSSEGYAFQVEMAFEAWKEGWL